MRYIVVVEGYERDEVFSYESTLKAARQTKSDLENPYAGLKKVCRIYKEVE